MKRLLGREKQGGRRVAGGSGGGDAGPRPPAGGSASTGGCRELVNKQRRSRPNTLLEGECAAICNRLCLLCVALRARTHCALPTANRRMLRRVQGALQRPSQKNCGNGKTCWHNVDFIAERNEVASLIISVAGLCVSEKVVRAEVGKY